LKSPPAIRVSMNGNPHGTEPVLPAFGDAGDL
jgi:hypothetical protein